MKLEAVDLEGGITKVSLAGRLDIDGVLAIDQELNAIAERKNHIVVDLSEVTFLASLGIRTLVTGAKATAANGGKLVLLSPQPNVEKVLRATNVDRVMPIVRSLEDVEAVFLV